MLTTLLPGFAGTALPIWLRDRLRAGLGGVCLYAQNISSPGQLRALTDAIMAENPYAIIAMDEEGGDVTRLFAATGAPFPGNAVLGRLDDLDTTRDTAAAIGWSLRRAGCTVNFAPCVDVNSRSDNPVIGVRSFSSDAERVARHGRAWVAGLQSTGVAATAKHFPGHGDTAQDSHVSLPVVNRSLDELRSARAAAVRRGHRSGVSGGHDIPHPGAATGSEPPGNNESNCAARSAARRAGLLRGDCERRPGHGWCLRFAGDGGGSRRCVASRLRSALSRDREHRCSASRYRARSEQRGRRGHPYGQQGVGSNEPGARARRGSESRAAGSWAASRSAPGWPKGEAELVHAFDVQPGASDWRARASGRYTVVRLEANPNIAVGATPWGPFAAHPPPSRRSRCV